MHIVWNKVTVYSKLLALIVFLVVAGFGVYASIEFQKAAVRPFGNDLLGNEIEDPNAPLPAGVKIYLSEKYSVKFNYLASEGDPVIEEGDRIFVHGKSGQSVQIFPKDPADTLEQAIKARFLGGIRPSDCHVEIWEANQAWKGYGANQAFGSILYTIDPANPDKNTLERNKCPKNYRASNGLSYFMMDKNHPGKFFFFNIGQYAIKAEPDLPGSGEKTWQQTFRVLK